MSLIKRYRKTRVVRALKPWTAVWELDAEDVLALSGDLR